MTFAKYTYRSGRNDDSDALIALLGSCFAEYENCVLDVDGEIPELRAIADAFTAWGGEFRVAERDGRVVACVGFARHEGGERGHYELKKLYAYSDERGAAGPAGPLVDWVEEAVVARGGTTIDLWSDTRFTRAHRFYEKRGYQKSGEMRELFDKSDTIEFRFVKRLGAVHGSTPA
jgi:putative acetyltransferase